MGFVEKTMGLLATVPSELQSNLLIIKVNQSSRRYLRRTQSRRRTRGASRSLRRRWSCPWTVNLIAHGDGISVLEIDQTCACPCWLFGRWSLSWGVPIPHTPPRFCIEARLVVIYASFTRRHLGAALNVTTATLRNNVIQLSTLKFGLNLLVRKPVILGFRPSTRDSEAPSGWRSRRKEIRSQRTLKGYPLLVA